MLVSSIPEAPEIPPHIVDINFNQYPINSAPAYMERTAGNTDLYVKPFSDDAQLMGQANTLQANVMGDRLSKLETLLKEQEEAHALNNELPLNEGEFLDILRERLELESKFNVLARINTRLSGGTPDRESKTNIKTETVVGKKAILGQAAVRASSHTGEVRLNGLEAFTIIDNLELTSADLRGEAEQESMHATQAAHEAEKIGTESIQKRKHESDQITHADRANVLNKRADDMLKLRSHLLRSLHSVKATASVPKPKVSVIS